MADDPGAGSTRSSLERLKALDSLPNLSTQLREANQLCDHSARAEMISRWLLGKLKSEAEARGSVEAWDTLLSAFRLLSPQKVAVLLSTHDLLGTCKSALEPLTNGQRTGVSLAFVRIFKFLLEVVAGPQGAQLKAVLSVSPPQAASFLDIWIDSTLTLVGIALFENGLAHDMLHPIFEIWNMRRRAADENETFAKHCLLSASRLLPIVNHYEGDQKLKRRRDDDGSLQWNYKQMLESMLARHIFVPARIAFFKAQDAAETKAKRQVGFQDPTFVLRSMFEPLHNDDSNNTGLDEGQLAVLTDLFSVAVRCLPRNTPKQRIKEKHWLDTVFKALSECMQTLNSNSTAVRDALRDMLSIAKDKQVVLSRDIMDDLIKRHSGLTSGKNIDWKLISRILQIDSDAFSDETMVSTLLTEITSATSNLPEDMLSESMPLEPPTDAVSSRKGLINFLRKQVILPVMKSFADQRKLSSFVNMWAAQISDSNHEKTAAIWTDLAADFSPLMEESLADDKVLALFDQYSTPIKTSADSQARHGEHATLSKLRPSIIIAAAILSGVRREALSDAIHGPCGELFQSMLGSEHDNSAPEASPLAFLAESQSWTLMTKAFELWFPAWAVAQSDAKLVAETGIKIVRSEAYNTALFKLGVSGHKNIQAAEVFISCVCAHLHKYDQVDVQDLYGRGMPRRSCLDSISMSFAGGVPHESTWPILIQFPNLITDLDGDETINLIEDCIRSGSPSATDALQAFTAYIFQHTDKKKIDGLVETFLLYLSNKKRPDAGGDSDDEIVDSLCEGYEVATLKAISGLSTDSISRPHREKILNAICTQQHAESQPTGPEKQSVQTWRFVALTSLMKLPNATCNLAVDAEELWRLTKSVVENHPDQNVVPIVEELTIQLTTHLLASQDQERNRSMLIGFGDIIRDFMQETSTRSRVDPDGCDATLPVIMALMVRLEAGSKEELKSKFSYRNPKTLNSFLAVCLDEIKEWCTEHAPLGFVTGDLQWALKALLSMPEALLQYAKTDTGSWHGPIVELIETCFTAMGNEDKRDHDGPAYSASAVRDVAVDGFHIACKVSTNVYDSKYTTLARSITKLQLTPTKRASFITAFGLYVQKLESQQYAELLNNLLSTLRVELDATHSILPLVEVCVSNLDKAKLGAIESPLLRLVASLLSLTELDPNILVRKRAMACVATTLKGNASLVNQYCIEMTLASLERILRHGSKAQRIYLDICQVLSTILLQYRSRLQGRFHLIVVIFQSLLSGLFQPANSNNSADEKEWCLTAKHAQALARLLTLFCDPPQYKRSSKASGLVDEARKEQAHVGKSVPYILHHYCGQVLNGKMGPGMREAIKPGLWSIIEAMEMGEAEGVKTLSAAMNNSERAVLRGVYDDWRLFGRWRGA